MKRTVSILLVLLYVAACLGFFFAVSTSVYRAVTIEKMVDQKELVAVKGVIKI